LVMHVILASYVISYDIVDGVSSALKGLRVTCTGQQWSSSLFVSMKNSDTLTRF